MKPPVIFLVGPTASGKTEIALNLAKKLNAEIISCDSMQVYKRMDILTSKPSVHWLKKIKHHLLSIKSPKNEFNVSEYRNLALKKIKSIYRKGKIPLFVGGTGFYMGILLDGIFPEADRGEKIREKLYKEAEKFGGGKLYERLSKVDPKATLKIHPNDLRRVVRALEVFEKTGKPISHWQKQRQGILEDYDVRVFCIKRSRAALIKRINARVNSMCREGALGEVKNLLKQILSRTASLAIGIREIKGYLNGEYDLDEAKRQMQHNTRLYAKRQMTWFKKDKRIEWIKAAENDSPAKITGIIWRKLS